MGAVSPRPIVLKSESPGELSGSGSERSGAITKLSISRNYVIPPRPKPGRKPSNDTPPSRRKVQNRDAQRAFRERKSRAVRILEEQLVKQAQEFEKQQALMREQISKLQRQNTRLHHASPEVFPFVNHAEAQYQGSPSHMPAVGSILQPNLPGGTGSITPMQLKPIMSPAPYTMLSQPLSPQHIVSPQSPGSPFGTPVTPADVAGLELLDHVLDQKLPVRLVESTDSSAPPRRPSRSSRSSPESPQSPGVVRVEPPAANNPLDLVNTTWYQPAVPLRRKSKYLEVDFTMAFTPRSPRLLSLRSPPAPKDRCGFCTDTAPCICAASAAREEGADMAPDLATLGSPLSSGDSGSLVTSASSFLRSQRSSLSNLSFETGSQSLPQRDNTPGECSGNPGNCSQCREDPMLTLFCSAVASKPPALRIPALGTFIPALAAYKTLSRHPRFAFADLGEVVSVLLVKSSQIEVNSVAKVLRLLDTK